MILLFLLLLLGGRGCSKLLLECDTVKYADCSEVLKQGLKESGVYTLHLYRGSVEAYCDMDTDGGGWTVIQRRMDGTVNFYRPWDQYREGFGVRTGEHWLGLQHIFMITALKKYELRVDIEDFDGKKVFAKYSSFSVASEGEGYKLYVSGFTEGGAGDSLSYHSGQKFSTFDKDQDASGSNCARLHLGAYWYNSCHYSNLNGVYRWGAEATINYVGIEWYTYKGYNYSHKSVIMMIRPVP